MFTIKVMNNRYENDSLELKENTAFLTGLKEHTE